VRLVECFLPEDLGLSVTYLGLSVTFPGDVRLRLRLSARQI